MLDNSIKTIPKGWKTHILKNEVQFLKGIGLSKNMVVDNGKNKCVLYGELYTKYNESIKKVVSSTNSSEGTKSKAGDVLMPGSTTTKGIDLANAVAINEDNVLLGGDIIIIRDKNKIFNNYYFAHYLTHIRKKDIERLTQGTTIIHLYPRSLENLDITLPPINEQEKIAKILSKVDEDIDRTEEIIKKTEELKKGLMGKFFNKKLKKKVNFINCIDLYSLKKLKGLKKKEYQDKGEYPIFDQGKKYISGYTDNKDLVNNNYPVILFGDHTRVVKFINQPFVVGADGTKVFQSRKENDPKFIYYSLLNLDIPNTGYNRHFKWVKEAKISLPLFGDQKRIVKVLSSVDKKIGTNKQIKNKLIQLKKSLMNDLLSGRVRV